MINDELKRKIKKCLLANGFDATVVDELIIERKTLRDEMAMAAVTGQAGRMLPFSAATDAYKIADEMLVVRKHKEQGE